MAKTLADVKARMPLKRRGILNKEYGVRVEVNKILGTLNYTVGGKKLTPSLRFAVKGNRIIVRVYNPGEWESALKKAYEDLMAQSGAFEGFSVGIPEAIGYIGEESRPPKRGQHQKDKGFFAHLTGIFTKKSED